MLAFHGLPETEAKIAATLNTNPQDGTRATAIIELARRLGLQVEEREGLTLSDVAHGLAHGAPVICCVQMHGSGHWVVVTGVDAAGVTIMDPIQGQVTVPRADFEAAWVDLDGDGRRLVRYGIAIGPAQLQEAQGRDIALGGNAGEAVDALLGKAQRTGAKLLAELSRRALTRYVEHGMIVAGSRFFSDRELAELADILARVQGTAGMLGRALVRDHQQRLKDKHEPAVHEAANHPVDFSRLFRDLEAAEIPLLEPEQAVRYFADLVPTLGQDPQRYGADLRRHAFTLARATDTELLGRIQTGLADVLKSGQAIGSAPKIIDQILDQAGLTSSNPQYSEMVMRTNLMDGYNQQATQELQDPDVIDTFPVWQYSAVVDSRSRPWHAERDGLYWPSSVAFVQVRGTGIEDAGNCRCTFIPIDKWTWAKLQAGGAVLQAA